LAGFEPAGVLVEIMNDDGTMARLPQLKQVAEKFDFKLISIKDLIEYRLTGFIDRRNCERGYAYKVWAF